MLLICSRNNNAHNEEIGILYEEMEKKLNAEKQRLRNEASDEK